MATIYSTENQQQPRRREYTLPEALIQQNVARQGITQATTSLGFCPFWGEYTTKDGVQTGCKPLGATHCRFAAGKHSSVDECTVYQLTRRITSEQPQGRSFND